MGIEQCQAGREGGREGERDGEEREGAAGMEVVGEHEGVEGHGGAHGGRWPGTSGKTCCLSLCVTHLPAHMTDFRTAPLLLLLLLPYHSSTSAAEAAQCTVHIHHLVCFLSFFYCGFGAEQEAGSRLCGCLLGIVVDHCR